MCYSGNCHYERFDGECGGRPSGRLTHVPACFEDGDLEAYNESVEADAILDYELRRDDRMEIYL